MNGIVMRLNRRLDEQPNNTTLVVVKRQMEDAVVKAQGAEKLDARQLKAFADAADTMRESFRGDTELSDQLFDLLDFLEYRVG